MGNHDEPDLGIERIPQQRDDAEDDEEQDIQAEEDVRDDVQPESVPGEVEEEDGDDSRAHVYGEPSVSGRCRVS